MMGGMAKISRTAWDALNSADRSRLIAWAGRGTNGPPAAGAAGALAPDRHADPAGIPKADSIEPGHCVTA